MMSPPPRHPVIFITSYSQEDSRSLKRWKKELFRKNITKLFSWFHSGKVWIDTNQSFQCLLCFFSVGFEWKKTALSSHHTAKSKFVHSFSPKSVYFIVTYSQGRKNGTRTEQVSQLQGQNCWRPKFKSDCKIKKAIPILEITHTCVCIYIHIYVHKHVCMCIYMYICTLLYVHACIHVYACTYKYIYI